MAMSIGSFAREFLGFLEVREARLLSWGFNTAVENTSVYVFPFNRPAGDTLIPMAPISLMSRYALTNEGKYAPDAMKSLLDSVDLTVYKGWVGSGSTPENDHKCITEALAGVQAK